MVETVIVVVIVGVVLGFTARSFYRTLTGRNDGCGCGKRACAVSADCNEPGRQREAEGPDE